MIATFGFMFAVFAVAVLLMLPAAGGKASDEKMVYLTVVAIFGIIGVLILAGMIYSEEQKIIGEAATLKQKAIEAGAGLFGQRH